MSCNEVDSTEVINVVEVNPEENTVTTTDLSTTVTTECDDSIVVSTENQNATVEIPTTESIVSQQNEIQTVDAGCAGYVLFPATATQLGGVKIGAGINVTADGTISVSGSGVGTVTSVGIIGTDGIGVADSPITSSGDITLSLGAITPDSVASAGTVTGSNLSGTNTGDVTIGSPANGLAIVGQILSIAVASALTIGVLSAADWTAFDAKQPAGSYITALTGDVTATGPGSVAATIANDAVTFAKMQNISTNKLLGRATASSGDVEEISLGTGFSVTGGTLTLSISINDLSDAYTNYPNGNLFLGQGVGGAITSGTANTGAGVGALAALTTGINNVVYGAGAGSAITSGIGNVAIGQNALHNNIDGGNNVAIGQGSLQNLGALGNANNNVAVGYFTMPSAIQANRCTAIGSLALQSNDVTGSGSAEDNVGVGYGAGFSNQGGNGHALVGSYALFFSSNSVENSVLGFQGLLLNSSGSRNVAIGKDAGYAGTPNTTGSDLTFLGSYSGSTANNRNNSTAVGAGSRITASNQVVLGNTSVTAVLTTGVVTAPNYVSNVATGTQPYATTSTTLNTNLNADMVDGFHASSFALAALTNTHIYVGNASNIATDVALSGDATLANTGALTLATVNSNVGSFGSSTSIPSFTVNAKGLITAASGNVVIAPAGTLTGTTLAANVVTSSLTAVGTIVTGTWSATTIAVNKGGTGQTSYTNGQLLIGNTTGNTLTKATLTGTTNQVNITNGAGSITLSTPQDIAITSNVNFNSVTANNGQSLANPQFIAGYRGLGTEDTNIITWGSDADANYFGYSFAMYWSNPDNGSYPGTLVFGDQGGNLPYYIRALGFVGDGSALTGVVNSVSGTTNRITSTGGATPVIDISASYVGQTSITTLGTVATGTWNATNIALNKGGTNASLTASNGGIVYSTSSAMAILAGTATAGQIIRSGASAAPTWSTATYPATAGTAGNVLRSDGTNFLSATLAGSDITGAALTKTDDTNVTLTLGGTPTTALLRAASLTLGWTGTLAVSRGGTGVASFGAANRIIYTTSSTALATSSNFTYDGSTFSVAVNSSTVPAALLSNTHASGIGAIYASPNLPLRTQNAASSPTKYGDYYFDGINTYASSGSTTPFTISTNILSGSFGSGGGDIVFKPNGVETFRTAKEGMATITTSVTIGTQAVVIDQNDTDQAFIDWQGSTTTDDPDSSIASITTFDPHDGNWTLDGNLLMEINGTDRRYITYQTYCVTGDTIIDTPKGLRRIDEIEVGDVVYSRCNTTKRIVENTVAEIEIHENTPDYYLINGTLKITGNHHLLLNSQWLPARLANPGDRFVGIAGGIECETVEYIEGLDITTYNLKLESSASSKNYFADGICIHNAKCPRIDAWIDGKWVEVGRAIMYLDGKEKEGQWDINLPIPAQKFRMVEDEPEISYVRWIKGDGEDWGLGEVITSPASYFGATDGSIHEFQFSKPVAKLETYGHYEVVKQEAQNG